jgi:hypothetical protein
MMESMQLPNYLIVGVPRAGTTMLARLLGQHPEIFMAREKELRFFDRHFDRGLQWYSAQFADARERMRGEATPFYLYSAQALERLANHLPQARLLVCVRDPVHRAYSHYWLKRAITGSTERMPNAAAEWARLLHPYLEQGRYVGYLERLTNYFARESIHVVVLEEFARQPAIEFACVCRHLSVSEAFEPPGLGQRAGSHVEYRSVWLRNKAKTWPMPLRKAVGKLNVRAKSYPPLPREIYSALSVQFADHNRQFATWAGLTASPWPIAAVPVGT